MKFISPREVTSQKNKIVSRLRPPFEWRKNFLFLRFSCEIELFLWNSYTIPVKILSLPVFSCEIELFPLKFLRDSCEIPAFQTGPQRGPK